jgi:hypothetical protein
VLYEKVTDPRAAVAGNQPGEQQLGAPQQEGWRVGSIGPEGLRVGRGVAISSSMQRALKGEQGRAKRPMGKKHQVSPAANWAAPRQVPVRCSRRVPVFLCSGGCRSGGRGKVRCI